MAAGNADTFLVDMTDCEPGMLIQSPHGELMRILSVEPDSMTVSVVYPKPDSPQVRGYRADMVARMHPPKESLLRKYDEQRHR